MGLILGNTSGNLMPPWVRVLYREIQQDHSTQGLAPTPLLMAVIIQILLCLAMMQSGEQCKGGNSNITSIGGYVNWTNVLMAV